MIGKKFDKLLVIEEDPDKKYCFICKCECGNIKSIFKYSLVSGTTKSCGCSTKSLLREAVKTHGMKGTPIYKTWDGLKQRCLNPNNKNYKGYGGRGIAVSPRWLGQEGFQNFFEDVGQRPGPEYSLDRINNDGNYEPGNVRWATSKQQGRNRRDNVLDEVLVSQIKWAYIDANFSQYKIANAFGVSRSTVEDIIHNKTWRE